MAITVGMKSEQQDTVTMDKTAKVWVSGDLEVYATPAMLLFMEKVSKELVGVELAEDETTVGTLLDVKHLSASPVGSTIRCISELIEVDRKRLVFHVEAYDQAGLIGEGTHERFIVNMDKFMEKANAKLK